MKSQICSGRWQCITLLMFVAVLPVIVTRAATDEPPKAPSISNAALEVMFDSPGAAFSVTDKRTGKRWRQVIAADQFDIINTSVRAGTAELTAVQKSTSIHFKVDCTLVDDLPELVVTIAGDGPLNRMIGYPAPFVSGEGDRLIVPMNEGIGYPVDDDTIGPMTLVGYGGHGICMSFWGVTNGRGGCMAIIETPDDARLKISRVEQRLSAGVEWESQKGQFGYVRRLRYVFFDKGDHVEMCKRYRRFVMDRGTFKTLRQKLAANPNVDLLIGAVNVWCWDNDALAIVNQMQAAGIDRILWSCRQSPDVIERMNALPGVLTSRYDIYQDLMDPEVVKNKLRSSHPDWTQQAWPDDLMLDAKGNWLKGWQVKGKDGLMYPCGVLCDRQAVKYAEDRVAEELKTHPYRCRFIDTTTASPWRECYDPRHPMTRTDSRIARMRLLEYMSGDMNLVTGSETGHDAAVPYVHYFEGMMSLGPYRIPDAGRNMAQIVDDVPQRVAKFQVGENYRLPLWELVYHDSVVSQWYWGDYNNKLPAIWNKRDLFNILYANGPMFMFTKTGWQQNKDRFAKSCRDICPVIRSVGYQEMVAHRILTADFRVQQTQFANGTTITVNFGDTPYQIPAGPLVAPMSYAVVGPSTASP